MKLGPGYGNDLLMERPDRRAGTAGELALAGQHYGPASVSDRFGQAAAADSES